MRCSRTNALTICSLLAMLSACSGSGTSANDNETAGGTAGDTTGMTAGGTTPSTQAIEFVQMEETQAYPISAFVDGAEDARGISNDDGLLHILINNQKVVVFTETAELVDQFDIPTLGTVSAQAIAAQYGQVAVLDSQGQLYVKRSALDAIDVVSYNYPETQDFAALTFGQNADEWLAINRLNEKTLYTLKSDGSFTSMALDQRLNEYSIVGADIDMGRMFVLANRIGQERTSSVFEIDSQGLVAGAWRFPIESGYVPEGLNVADPEVVEFVIAFSDPMATVKVFELPLP